MPDQGQRSSIDEQNEPHYSACDAQEGKLEYEICELHAVATYIQYPTFGQVLGNQGARGTR